MSEMVKRVADAIRRSTRLDDSDWEAAARAAIEAMLEPTDAMVQAADDCDDSSPGGSCASSYTHWGAMIRRALKE